MIARMLLLMLMLWTVSCNRNELPPISTNPLFVYQSGNKLFAEGSWRKDGGTMLDSPVNTSKIECSAQTNECIIDSAEVFYVSGTYSLKLFPRQEYATQSWANGILLALRSEPNHDSTLRISIEDKTVTRTMQGKGQHSEDSLIESLK